MSSGLVPQNNPRLRHKLAMRAGNNSLFQRQVMAMAGRSRCCCGRPSMVDAAGTGTTQCRPLRYGDQHGRIAEAAGVHACLMPIHSASHSSPTGRSEKTGLQVSSHMPPRSQTLARRALAGDLPHPRASRRPSSRLRPRRDWRGPGPLDSLREFFAVVLVSFSRCLTPIAPANPGTDHGIGT